MWLKQLGEMLQATPKAPGTKGNLAGKDSSGGRITRPPEKSYSDAGGNRHQQRHIRTRSETRQPAGLSPTTAFVCADRGSAAIRGAAANSSATAGLEPPAHPPGEGRNTWRK